MNNKQRVKSRQRSCWTTIPGCLAGIAAILTAIGGLITVLFAVGIFNKPPTPEQTPGVNTRPATETAQCSISGLIFDSDSNTPLSGVLVDVFRDLSAIHQRPERLKAGLATTGPDGTFSFDCSWVEEFQFPIVLAVHHADWVETRITAPKIDRSGHWDGIKIAIPMSEIEMKSLSDVLVSFSSQKNGSDWFVVGEVENISDESMPCVKLSFSMSTSYQDQLQGEPIRDLGILEIEIRDLRPHENRAYEKQLPQPAGFGLSSKEECQ
jgi:hypothetical protein